LDFKIKSGALEPADIAIIFIGFEFNFLFLRTIWKFARQLSNKDLCRCADKIGADKSESRPRRQNSLTAQERKNACPNSLALGQCTRNFARQDLKCLIFAEKTAIELELDGLCSTLHSVLS
jgi:hypothetical protein